MNSKRLFFNQKERQCRFVFFVKDSVNASYLEDSISDLTSDFVML